VTLLLTLLVLAVAAAVAAVATGRITGGLDSPASSLPARLLPDGDVGAADVERVRFSPALRGYRMAEVDEVLDRLGAELARRDEVIAALERRAAVGTHPDGSDPDRNGGARGYDTGATRVYDANGITVYDTGATRALPEGQSEHWGG
jgi:DivIVA domain-containing protein